MSIDPKHEKLLTLAQASAYVPARRGRRTASSTLLRWVLRGKRGVKLDGLRTPAGWLTSLEAIQRFMTALAELDRRGKTRDVAAEAEEAKRRACWADQVLDAAGVGVPKRKKG